MKRQTKTTGRDALDFVEPTHHDDEGGHGAGPRAESHDSDSSGADDALGLYLRQIGAIPLLNRAQELALAKRLENKRDRFRRAALMSRAFWTASIRHFKK